MREVLYARHVSFAHTVETSMIGNERPPQMLTSYIDAAMRKGKYKILGGREGIFGAIPGFRGLWASAKSVEECRHRLRSVLEDWLIIKLRHNDNDLPVVSGIDLNPRDRKKKVA